jgi:hypothetical protein
VDVRIDRVSRGIRTSLIDRKSRLVVVVVVVVVVIVVIDPRGNH